MIRTLPMNICDEPAASRRCVPKAFGGRHRGAVGVRRARTPPGRTPPGGRRDVEVGDRPVEEVPHRIEIRLAHSGRPIISGLSDRVKPVIPLWMSRDISRTVRSMSQIGSRPWGKAGPPTRPAHLRESV